MQLQKNYSLSYFCKQISHAYQLIYFGILMLKYYRDKLANNMLLSVDCCFFFKYIRGKI